MYGLIREGLAGITLGRGGKRDGRVGSTVLLLGLTSMFTDVSSEMVTAVLPIYLLFQQQASVVQFGIIDGLYQGASALFRLVAGFLADRLDRQKEVAAAGYALSMLTRLGMILTPGATAFMALVAVDRFGKGIRTAPRDALISRAASDESLGAAFGLHRALDTVGAMLGPILAFAVLALAPRRFDAVFVLSLSFAVIGVAIIALFVRNPQQPAAAKRRPTFAESLRVLREAGGFRAVVVAGGMVAFFTLSDAFVYLVLQRTTDVGMAYFPLLFLGTSIAYFLLAIPLGRVADRIGRVPTFLGGQMVLLAVYGVLLLAPSMLAATPGVTVALTLLLFGAFYASTDGVLAAAASATLPDAQRASGLSILGTVTAVARLASSVAFGVLWTVQGPTAALLLFTAGLAVTVVLAAGSFRRASRGAGAHAA
ncbi:MAG: MFS transporter [Dehalococcoidia bacterium]